jgi:hypothetical protein
MIDERLDVLINEELDGTLTAEGDAELRERLERDPEARLLRERLRHLARTLEQMPAAEPPPGLRAQIAVAVRLREARAAGRTSPFRSVAPDGRRLPRLRLSWSPGLAYSFAAGLAVGCALIALLRSDGPESSAMVESADAVIDQFPVALAGVEGMVVLRREAGRLTAEVALRGETETTVEFTLGGARWTASHVGESRYSLDLGPAEKLPGEVGLSIRAGGASIEKLLSIRGPR